jgi:hypothetical protein
MNIDKENRDPMDVSHMAPASGLDVIRSRAMTAQLSVDQLPVRSLDENKPQASTETASPLLALSLCSMLGVPHMVGEFAEICNAVDDEIRKDKRTPRIASINQIETVAPALSGSTGRPIVRAGVVSVADKNKETVMIRRRDTESSQPKSNTSASSPRKV